MVGGDSGLNLLVCTYMHSVSTSEERKREREREEVGRMKRELIQGC